MSVLNVNLMFVTATPNDPVLIDSTNVYFGKFEMVSDLKRCCSSGSIKLCNVIAIGDK